MPDSTLPLLLALQEVHYWDPGWWVDAPTAESSAAMTLGTRVAAVVVPLVWFTLARMGSEQREHAEERSETVPLPASVPWSVLTRPKDAFEWGLQHQLGQSIYVLASIAGLAKVQWPLQTPQASDLPVMALMAVFSSFMGIVVLELSSYVLTEVGERLGGTSNRHRVRSALAWSWAVTIVTAPILFALTAFTYQATKLGSDFPLSETRAQALPVLTAWLTSAASIWYTAVLVIGISTAHRFSKTRAFLTILIPAVALFFTCFGVAFFFGDVSYE